MRKLMSIIVTTIVVSAACIGCYASKVSYVHLNPHYSATEKAADPSKPLPSAGILNQLIVLLAVEGQMQNQSPQSRAQAYVGYKIYYEMVKIAIEEREKSEQPLTPLIQRDGVDFTLQTANFRGWLSELSSMCDAGRFTIDIDQLIHHNPLLKTRAPIWKQQNALSQQMCVVAKKYIDFDSLVEYRDFDAQTKKYARFFYQQLRNDHGFITGIRYPSAILLSAEGIKYSVLYQRQDKQGADRIQTFSSQLADKPQANF